MFPGFGYIHNTLCLFDLFILPELEILYASATLLLIIYNYLLDPESKHARNLEAHDDDHSYTA